jgi:hypothetical protein
VALLVLAVSWALLIGAWFLLVDTSSVAEWSAAVAAGLVATLAAWVVYESGVARMRPSLVLLRGLGRQLVRVPPDFWLLARELGRALAGRHRAGRFHELRLPLPVNARGDARRATIETLGSLAPNTIVLGIDEEGVIVHQLAARHEERSSVEGIGA